jgi:hypothetical protein
LTEDSRDLSSPRQWPTWLKVLVAVLVVWGMLVAGGVAQALLSA